MRHARPDYNRMQDPEGKIGEDEPVFILRAQDELAPATIDHWSNLLEAHDGDPRAVKLARDWAQEMRHWQISHKTKLPDLPQEG